MNICLTNNIIMWLLHPADGTNMLQQTNATTLNIDILISAAPDPAMDNWCATCRIATHVEIKPPIAIGKDI